MLVRLGRRCILSLQFSESPTQSKYSIRKKLLDLVYFYSKLPSLWQLQPLENSNFSNIIDNNSSLITSLSLSDLFTYYGSDKSTHHDYHLLYEELYRNKRLTVRTVIEIGIGSNNLLIPQNMGENGRPGASLRAFRDWFPNAKIIGLDIDKDTMFKDERIQTFCIDQLDRKSFSLLSNEISLAVDVVVVDGLHTPRADLNTLLELLPMVSRTGYFVIEDISRKSALFLWKVAIVVLSRNYSATLRRMKNGYVLVIAAKKK